MQPRRGDRAHEYAVILFHPPFYFYFLFTTFDKKQKQKDTLTKVNVSADNMNEDAPRMIESCWVLVPRKSRSTRSRLHWEDPKECQGIEVQLREPSLPHTHTPFFFWRQITCWDWWMVGEWLVVDGRWVASFFLFFLLLHDNLFCFQFTWDLFFILFFVCFSRSRVYTRRYEADPRSEMVL